MKQDIETKAYQPGYYGKKRLSASEWADAHVKKWLEKNKKVDVQVKSLQPCICISREIGVGALEVADDLSKIVNLRVIDREIVEYMAADKGIGRELIEYYDERYPGITNEFFSMLIKEKTFTKGDYARQIIKTVNSLAIMAPTIFVGRGTHLILPRDKTLSIRLVCSRTFRLNRLAKLLKTSVPEVEKKIKIIDSEQHDFFKTVYNRKKAEKEEFDIIINRDYFETASQVANIVASAFEQKFGPKGRPEK